MKIAHMIDTLQWGGAQKLLTTFAAEAMNHEVDTTVISLNADREIAVVAQKLQAANVSIERLPAAKMFAPRRFIELIRLLRRERFDVLQTHLTYANILGPLAAMFARTPVIGTLHLAGADPSLVPRKQHLENRVLRYRAQRLVAVGFVVAEVYKTLLPGRIIEVIPNAVDPLPPISAEQRAALRAELLDDPDAPFVLAVGRLNEIKDFPTLIDGWAIVVARYPTAQLRIAGGGAAEAAIREAIARHGLDQRILLGQRDDVPDLLQAADLFASSSKLEGLPVAVLEALAAGLPVVATDVGDVARVVVDQTGIVVPPQDALALAQAINTLLDDPAQMQQMKQAARRHVQQHYNPEQWFKQLFALYQDVQG